ncbi:GQ67_04311T0 [Komagataella phaffii]|nr:GQ67_04311T0 [Komagataella phaffii]AOA69926.1 GQ68_04283T0 [Komagataella phaffii GS115]
MLKPCVEASHDTHVHLYPSRISFLYHEGSFLIEIWFIQTTHHSPTQKIINSKQDTTLFSFLFVHLLKFSSYLLILLTIIMFGSHIRIELQPRSYHSVHVTASSIM